MPVGDAPDLIRCRFGLLAADPARERIELVHVVERASRRAAAASLLGDLSLAYGVATRLVVAGEDDAIAALNAAAEEAQAPLLAFLAADVVPEVPGWLARLARLREARPGCALAASRVLNEDESIVDAGLELAEDADGDHAAPAAPRGVPARFLGRGDPTDVPFTRLHAALTTRAAWTQAGGLGRDWLTADARDADLAARLRARGGAIWQFPEVVALRLGGVEAKPLARGLDPRIELDRRQFAARWRALEPVVRRRRRPPRRRRARVAARERGRHERPSNPLPLPRPPRAGAGRWGNLRA